ncbi:MAG TPA: hypothetical protein VEK08_17945 [Planctomycetota bacterium]|nr:hypothetical protein [Planctomycetota bacterium]
MKRFFQAAAWVAMVVVLNGCNEDQRNTEEKLNAPAPDFSTRPVMACPKCGAPQRPFRIDAIKSYYRCTGQPPKFPFHNEKTWIHRPHDGER